MVKRFILRRRNASKGVTKVARYVLALGFATFLLEHNTQPYEATQCLSVLRDWNGV